jgi:hypothetical protein
MPFKTACPNCAKKLQVPDAADGKRVKCPACAHAWQVFRQLVAETVPEEPRIIPWSDDLLCDSFPSTPAPAPAAPPAPSLVGKPLGALVSSCTLRGADINLSFGAAEVIERLRERLEKRLRKKKVALFWSNESNSPEIAIRIIKIDEGNQAMRYFIPFAAPAILEVAGRIAIPGSAPQQFRYTRKAHFGMFGGSPRTMLNICADRMSAKIAKDVLKAKAPRK